MTRVDFYVLAGGVETARDILACRIAEKAFAQAHKVYLHAASAAAAGQLDDLLWTFRDASFVPHALADKCAGIGSDELPPVLIGHRDAPDAHADLLINMSDEVPPFFDRFARIVELVDADGDRRRLGRERFRFYRDRGCPLETHRL